MNGVNGPQDAAVVLDIEGTTTPIAFVYEVLFPFVRAHLLEHLEAGRAAGTLATILGALHAEWAVDVEQGDVPPPWRDGHARDVAAYVGWLMDRDRKSTGLKALQGEVWRAGYERGELLGELFPDVAPALREWRRRGVPVAIFSSGSATAQRLLFGHTREGDLTPLISGYFDTSVGPKGEAASYRAIARTLGRPPAAVTFVSDVVRELDAARAAALRTFLSVRPGNPAQPAHAHPVIRRLDEVEVDDGAGHAERPPGVEGAST